MSAVVDLSRIQETSDGDTEFEDELISMYLDDAATHAKKISGFIERSEVNSLNATARTLKGASANIGAVAVQQVAFELEKAALTQVTAPLPDLNDRLASALAETDRIFRAYMASR